MGAVDAVDVIQVLDALDGAGVRHWVGGGWGVAALAGPRPASIGISTSMSTWRTSAAA